jgi:Transposase DNA-binding
MTHHRVPDQRLVWQLNQLVERLSQHPEASITQACGSASATKAAYRLLG